MILGNKPENSRSSQGNLVDSVSMGAVRTSTTYPQLNLNAPSSALRSSVPLDRPQRAVREEPTRVIGDLHTPLHDDMRSKIESASLRSSQTSDQRTVIHNITTNITPTDENISLSEEIISGINKASEAFFANVTREELITRFVPSQESRVRRRKVVASLHEDTITSTLDNITSDEFVTNLPVLHTVPSLAGPSNIAIFVPPQGAEATTSTTNDKPDNVGVDESVAPLPSSHILTSGIRGNLATAMNNIYLSPAKRGMNTTPSGYAGELFVLSHFPSR